MVTLEQVEANDFNLSPSRYISSGVADDVLPLEEAMVLLQEAEETRALADLELGKVLERLGLGALRV